METRPVLAIALLLAAAAAPAAQAPGASPGDRVGPRAGEPIDGGIAGTVFDSRLIAARAYASDAGVAPGERLALVVDVTPKPGMHVYAPGDHLYRVVRLRLDAPDFLRAHPLSYPPSELYHYEPLDETVPVYQQPFRLVQEITVPRSEETAALAAAPGGKLLIEGVLQYQACDDEVCYIPAEAPLGWELAWRPPAGE